MIRWNCDPRVINARKKASSVIPINQKRHHDAPITWPDAYYVTLGSCCKMANSSSEGETDTLPKRPTRIQPYQFEPARQDFERVLVFHGVWEITLTEVLATQMGVMRRSKKVRSFEVYKLNPLSPHCGLTVRELVHCYTWGCLQVVTVRGNTVGRHS